VSFRRRGWSGVGPGTLYRHFPTRYALLEAVYRTEVERLAAAEKEFSRTMPPIKALRAWMFGLGFSRDALRHAGQTLPVVAVAAVCLMSFCGLLAWCLMRLAHVDALTAYLATSPAGIDSVAIIAASTPRVDLSFVLAMQSMRLLFVIGLAPLITRLVVRHSAHLQASKN
jgi:membrane AbrB-like protein